ncbi:ubiquitin-like small modifier protein 1 [Micromonospora sp. NPDC049044]|uniref:ubiquitin-like small modifier protein 1 n=1 Tax=unclassified Micromonospora TaxID=2617518 RepID=UPI0033FF4A92
MRVRLPASLSQSGKAGMVDVDVPAVTTLRAVLAEIERKIPGATRRIMDEEGKLYRFVNLYVNGDDIRNSDGIDTTVHSTDEVLILPAVSGG